MTEKDYLLYGTKILNLKTMIDMWLNFKNSQSCPNAPDKTITEVLESRKRQNINSNILDDLMLATEVKTIQKNMNIS